MKRRNTGGGKPPIETLYGEFETAHAVYVRQSLELDAAGAGGLDSAWHKRFERSVKKCNKISGQLVRTPATSVAEIRLKLRIVAWRHADAPDCPSLEQFDEWKHTSAVEESEATRVLAGLHADLNRLAAQC
jgi:hypothetical protein